MHLLVVLSLLFSLAAFTETSAQSADLGKYTLNIDSCRIKSTLSFISDDLTRGRHTGTPGSMIVQSFIRQRFAEMAMIPFYSSNYTQSFRVELPPERSGYFSKDSIINGRNIIGVIPSLYYTDEYILISAHYDHLGIIGGRIYNGADDNASGVTALLTVADMFYKMRLDRSGPKKNIIFALFDAKEINMAGSEYFMKTLPINPSKISYAINLDQIGCTFAPPQEREDYLLYVASPSIRNEIKRRADLVNNFFNVNLEIDHTFYGSQPFYDIFLKTSDQYNMIKKGIPSVMFTSGIHMHTYKPTDDHYFINYPVFISRIRFIFYLADHLSRFYK